MSPSPWVELPTELKAIVLIGLAMVFGAVIAGIFGVVRRVGAARWIACHLPREVVYWCLVRAGVHASTGRWREQVVPELTLHETMERWEGLDDE